MAESLPPCSGIPRSEIISTYLTLQGQTWEKITNRVWADLVEMNLAAVPDPTKGYKLRMKKLKDLWYRNGKCISSFSKEFVMNQPFTLTELGFGTPKKRRRCHSEPPSRSNSLETDEEFSTVPDSPSIDFKSPKTPQNRTSKVLFNEACTKTKNKRTKNLLENMHTHSIPEVIYALKCYLKDHNISTAHDIIETVLKDMVDSKEILEKIRSNDTQISTADALALKNDLFLSEREYTILQSHFEKLDITQRRLPSIQKIGEEKKNCYPEGIINDHITAEVPLQNLLNKSVERLLESFGKSVALKLDNSLKLYVKVGFDGQSGHSQYHQYSKDKEVNDSSIFCVAATMLRFIDSNGNTVWQNITPNSLNWCRPISTSFTKESIDITVKWGDKLKKQVEHLQEYYVIMYGKRFEITFVVHLCMLDGLTKLRLTANPTHTNACPFCSAKPLERTSWDVYKEIRYTKVEYLMYGMSPLHLWIRCLEFILSLANKLVVKKMSVRKDEEKQAIEENKARVKNEIKTKIGVFVSKIEQGRGNSNTGSVSRKCFKNYKLLAEATGLSVELLRRFYVMLTVINSGFKLNPETFKVYAEETSALLKREYEWYHIPPAVHSMLVHTIEVQEILPFTLGESSEEAIEAANKRKRYVREYHTRKNSRENCILDLFHWELQATDPVILEKSMKKQFIKKKEMQNLLICEIV